MTTRLLPPSTGNATHKVNNRVYVGVVGTPQDINDPDAGELSANGWLSLGPVGTTAARPTTNLVVGQSYQDRDLGVPILWDGKAWRHGHSGAIV
jgi:hypothetical protein